MVPCRVEKCKDLGDQIRVLNGKVKFVRAVGDQDQTMRYTRCREGGVHLPRLGDGDKRIV